MRAVCERCGRFDFWRCERDDCPYQQRIASITRRSLQSKQEFTGQVPNVFVGRHGYPTVNVGLLSTERYTDQDSPRAWVRNQIPLEGILARRASLVNSRFASHIRSFSSRFSSAAQEVGLARKPVDVEVSLARAPTFSLQFPTDSIPFGESVALRSARILSNIDAGPVVERLSADSDAKASVVIGELSRRGVDEHRLTKLLSTGNVGLKSNRKLVPTRWSITAVDDQLGKRLLTRLRHEPVIDAWEGMAAEYLGNIYIALLLPTIWGFELFEGAASTDQRPGFDPAAFLTDAEGFGGRSTYASNTVGGYYASRLAVLEHLARRRRQAGVLLLRFVTHEYWAPLGVWVVREAVRATMRSRQHQFTSRDQLFSWAKATIEQRFPARAQPLLERSVLLRQHAEQRRLCEF